MTQKYLVTPHHYIFTLDEKDFNQYQMQFIKNNGILFNNEEDAQFFISKKRNISIDEAYVFNIDVEFDGAENYTLTPANGVPLKFDYDSQAINSIENRIIQWEDDDEHLLDILENDKRETIRELVEKGYEKIQQEKQQHTLSANDITANIYMAELYDGDTTYTAFSDDPQKATSLLKDGYKKYNGGDWTAWDKYDYDNNIDTYPLRAGDAYVDRELNNETKSHQNKKVSHIARLESEHFGWMGFGFDEKSAKQAIKTCFQNRKKELKKFSPTRAESMNWNNYDDSVWTQDFKLNCAYADDRLQIDNSKEAKNTLRKGKSFKR